MNIEQILSHLNITDYTITNRGVNVHGDVIIPEHYTEIPVQFNVVDVDFDCHCSKITSLKNGPHAVGGDFNCNWTKITSLKYSPKEVGGTFHCYDIKITSLLHGPQEVHGSFDCSHTKITSLQYAPMYIGENLWCFSTKIKGEPDISHIDLKGRLYWKY